MAIDPAEQARRDAKVLDFIVQKAARDLNAERVILFGSQSTGTATPRSDFDVCVESSAASADRRLWSRFWVEVTENVPTLRGLDLMLMSEVSSPSLKQVIQQEGKVIYERQET